MLAAVALPGGKLQLSDIYGNLLLDFQTEDNDEIIDIQSNPRGANTPDDMYVAALTQKGFLYVFSFELGRVDNWKDISQAQKDKKVLHDEDGNESLVNLVDYPYHKKYKAMLHQYEYTPKYPSTLEEKKKARKAKAKGEKVVNSDSSEPKKAYVMVDLSTFYNSLPENSRKLSFLQFASYQAKSKQFFVILDNFDRFTVLDRDLKFLHMIKTHSEQTDESQITSFARQGSALLYTRKNQVGFVHVDDGRLGPVSCSASHETTLTQVQTDYSSSVFIYALAPESNEIYVFRTSNLLTNPIAISCDLEMKVPLMETGLSN